MFDSTISNIQGVKDWLNAQTPGSTLTVSESLFDAELISALFALLSDEDIVLNDITYDTSTDDPWVTGTGSFLGYDDASIQLTFSESDGFLICNVEFGYTQDVQWWIVEALTMYLDGISGSIDTNTSLKALEVSYAANVNAGDNNYAVPIEITIPNYDGEWLLAGSFDQLGDLSVAILDSFGGDNPITTILPAELLDMQYFKLTEFQIAFNPDSDNFSCSYIKIGIAYEKPDGWQIFSDKFQFTGIEFDFEIFNAYGDLDTSYEATLIGKFDLAGVPINVGGSFPSKTVFVMLDPDQTFLVNDVFETMEVALPAGFPDVEISTLSFTFFTANNSYDFRIAILNAVAITDTVSLNNFTFELRADYNSTSDAITANGLLTTQFTIGSTIMGLAGNYKSPPDYSSLYGEVYNLPVGQLISELADNFGIGDLPDFLEELVIQKCTVFYSTDKNFKFYLEATTEMADKEIAIFIDIQTSYNDATDYYDGVYTGILIIDEQQFQIDFTTTSEDKIIAATWSETGDDRLNLQDIASVFGSEALTNLLGDIPPSMDLALKSASFSYNYTKNTLLLTASSDNYGNIFFAADKADVDGTPTWVFALGVAVNAIDLTQLPLVGEDLAQLGTVAIEELMLMIISNKLSQADVTSINALIQAAGTTQGTTYPLIPESEDGVSSGVDFSMVLDFLGARTPIAVGTARNNEDPDVEDSMSVSSYNAEDASASSTTKTTNGFWVTLQKAVGPIYFNRIGINYQDDALILMFDMSMTVTVLTIDLLGLSVGSKLDVFEPEFGLSGLGITYVSGPVEISGGFQAVQMPTYTEYNGQALIKTPTLNLGALGSYAQLDGETSLFVFAFLSNPPLGGPPYFFVTGVAAGFGYNRNLLTPSIENVASFPLVSGFVPGQPNPFDGKTSPESALQVLNEDNVVPVEIGQNWLAAGIQFNSFKLLESFALLAVEFGTKLEISLLGLSTASVPTGAPKPLMFAQLALSVRILPDDGLMSVEAQLTSSSYILDSSCHLTGGFAFYIWFGDNVHAGDFVVTLGGYHPNFDVPDYYPSVPKLGFNWIINSEMSIKGGMYFALTPTCLMAGGNLEAVWKSGNLKAWFTIGANFLIAWKPYHYEANLYVSFGVSYKFKVDLLFTTVTKTISVSLGAGLDIWGPSFSGTAYIHLWIISFSIDFGASANQQPEPISWDDFRESFLPTTTDTSIENYAFQSHALLLATDDVLTDSYCAANVSQGLVSQLEADEDNPEDINYIVNKHGTHFITNTVIPAKDGSVTVGGTVVDPSNFVNATDYTNRNQDFGIGPVGISDEDFDSAHSVTIEYEEGGFSPNIDIYVRAIIADVPKSLWLKQNVRTAGLDKETMITNVLVGFEIWTGASEPDVTPWVEIEVLLTNNTDYTPTLTWNDPDEVVGPEQPDDPFVELQSTIDNVPVRADILDTLVAAGFDIDPNVNVSHLAAEADEYLLAPPYFAYEYWKA